MMDKKLVGLIEELKTISPMPEDEKLTQELLVKYETILTELSGYRDSSIITPLIESFGYGNAYELYWMTLHLLEKLDLDKLYRTLLEKIDNGEKGSRLWSAYMLMRFRNPDAAPVITKLLDDPNELIRAQALETLSVLDPENVKGYFTLLKNDPSKVVKEKIEFLAGNM